MSSTDNSQLNTSLALLERAALVAIAGIGLGGLFGLVIGYRALLDARKLGLSLMALIHISMDRHTPERFSHFEAEVEQIPQVLECLLITGQDADYQLKVVVTDMDGYQALLLERITRIPGVTGVHSSFVLRRVIDKTALPLPGA